MATARLSVFRFDRFEDALGGLRIEAVHHFRHGIDASIRTTALLAQRFQFLVQNNRYLLNDFGRKLLHLRQALDHVCARLLGQEIEHN